MPYIQVDGTQHSLRPGETAVGTSVDAAIRVAGPESLGVLAILTLGADRTVSIRRAAPTSVVKVNGVQLGAEPTPLIHGDKIEVAGREMLFGDEKKSGGTQMLSGIAIPDLLGESAAAPARPTAATGGRLVSLVDGREYAIPAEGLSLGRDAGCDVVIPGSDVSRRHADIRSGETGYVIDDSSTNGVFVNGERVRKTQLLGRGDVVRIGSEEFRFYADVPAPAMATVPMPTVDPGSAEVSLPSQPPRMEPPPSRAPAVEPPALQPSPRPAAPRAPESVATPPAGAPAAGTAPGAEVPTSRDVPAPAEPAGAARPVLAVMEVTSEGANKGKRFELRLPLIHVGRGAHNDVALPDDSVSDSHAKLQKREDGWYVVDMGSTNGTYVAGRRIGVEQPLGEECDLRFGGAKLRFRVAAAAVDEARGTRAIAGVNVAEARRAAVAAREPAPDPADEPRRGIPAYVWVIALALLGLAVFFILQGQGR